jgi:hypothetical protein
MTLVDFGFPRAFGPIQAGLSWLKSEEVEAANNRYQRIAPYIALQVEPIETQKILNEIREYVKRGGFGPFPTFSLHMFLLRCLYCMGIRQGEEVELLLRDVLEDQDIEGDGGWRRTRKSPTTTAFGIWVLGAFGKGGFEDRIEKAIAFLKTKKIETPDPTRVGICWENNAASTAYIVMDLIGCGLYTRDDVRDIVDRAKDYIISKRTKEGSWPRDPPPFGGEVQDPEYFTSVSIRGLLAFNLLRNDAFLNESHIHWIMKCREETERLSGRLAKTSIRLRAYKLLLLSLALATTTFLVRMLIPPTLVASEYVRGLEITVTVGTIVAWIWAFGKKIWDWLART